MITFRNLAAVCAFFVAAAAAQEAGTIEGSVRDAQGRPVAGSSVYLKASSAAQATVAQSDAGGRYHFGGLSAGEYSIRVEGGASRAVQIAGPVTKQVDLTIDYAFFDRPDFVVAGVTDPAGHGGHGSDTVLRSAESLARATAGLVSGGGKEKDPIETVRAYQQAAERDPSEANLFNWGSELLLHGAPEQAAEVLGKGHRRYPQSVRMLLGLAAAWYARGAYEQAAESFFAACDVKPSDALPYEFLAKVQSPEITKLPGYVNRFARLARLQPDNAFANFEFGAALWEHRTPGDTGIPQQSLASLEKALRLDPAMAAAHMQEGIVYAALNEDAKAVAAFARAIQLAPGLEEAHYRLGQLYAKTGEKEKARRELELYQQMQAKSQQEAERERNAIPRFVIQLRDGKSSDR